MILLYLLLGLVFTSLLFLWFEADSIQCPFHRYLPVNPEVHAYIFLLVWMTWIVSVPIMVLAAAHMLYKEKLERERRGEHHGRNKK